MRSHHSLTRTRSLCGSTDAGDDPTAIATALGVEAAAVPMILRLGHEKRARLLGADDRHPAPPQ